MTLSHEQRTQRLKNVLYPGHLVPTADFNLPGRWTAETSLIYEEFVGLELYGGLSFPAVPKTADKRDVWCLWPCRCLFASHGYSKRTVFGRARALSTIP